MGFISNKIALLSHARAIAPGSLAVCAMLAASLAAPVAHAALGVCGSDPIVMLSDGTELEFSTTIDDLSADVQALNYTLYIPTGARVVLSIAGALGAKEQWSVVADMPPRTYETVTRVTAQSGDVPVTSTMQALGLIGLGASVASGQTDQNLTMRLSV